MMAERLLPLPAKAAANEVEACRDNRKDPTSANARLRDLAANYPTGALDHGMAASGAAQHIHAMQAWYDAELERGKAVPYRSCRLAARRKGLRRCGARLGRGLHAVARRKQLLRDPVNP
jgi:hypothetical protein